MPEIDADPLVDRLAALLCDDGCNPGPCHDSVSAAGRVLKFLANAGRLLPEGGQTRTEWGTTGKVSELVIPASDEASALRVAGRFRGSHVVRRTVVDGPWVAVDQEATDG